MVSRYKAAAVPICYAVLVIAGGLMGYIKAQSLASLAVSLALGLPTIAAGISIIVTERSGYFSALGMVAIATLLFHYRFVETQQFMPSGLMAVVSVATLVAMIVWRPDRKA